MTIERDIPAPPKRNRYDFASLKHGDSIHVETQAQRLSLREAFRQWRHKTGSALRCRTEAVGADDKKGPGFRAWFLNPAIGGQEPAGQASNDDEGEI